MMDDTQLPHVPAAARGHGNVPQVVPTADFCKQLWQQLENAMIEREKNVRLKEQKLEKTVADFDERVKDFALREQEKIALLEERSRSLDAREKKLLKREKQFFLRYRSRVASQPQDLEQNAPAAACVSGVKMSGAGDACVVSESLALSTVSEEGLALDHAKFGMAGPVKAEVEPVELLCAIEDGERVETYKEAQMNMMDFRTMEHAGVPEQIADEDLPLNVRKRKKAVVERKRKKWKEAGMEKTVHDVVNQALAPTGKSTGARTKSKELRLQKNISVESALEEDAPGLMETLRANGCLLDDLRLFGAGSEDQSEEGFDEHHFDELKDVVRRIWGTSPGLVPLLQPNQSSNPSQRNKPYCVRCLTSLIEQTRQLKRKKWPVQWGWCRQLHAFLFVFVRHNRIVLERPEYGFATYFFELVDSLPIQWQVQRLVTVMSVATVPRAAIMENKPVLIGGHLTAQEAATLMDYGWTPNSGIASLLNFCDRVVHDYSKSEGDTTEWKGKIGKLLMDGYDHGSMVKDIPRSLQYRETLPNLQSLLHVKVEDNSDGSCALAYVHKDEAQRMPRSDVTSGDLLLFSQ